MQKKKQKERRKKETYKANSSGLIYSEASKKEKNRQMNSKIIDLSILYSFTIQALRTQTLSSKSKRL